MDGSNPAEPPRPDGGSEDELVQRWKSVGFGLGDELLDDDDSLLDDEMDGDDSNDYANINDNGNEHAFAYAYEPQHHQQQQQQQQQQPFELGGNDGEQQIDDVSREAEFFEKIAENQSSSAFFDSPPPPPSTKASTPPNAYAPPPVEAAPSTIPPPPPLTTSQGPPPTVPLVHTPPHVQPSISQGSPPTVPVAHTPPAHVQSPESHGPPPAMPRAQTPAHTPAHLQPSTSHGPPPSVPLAYTPAHAQSPELHGPSPAVPRAKTPAYTPAHLQPSAPQGPTPTALRDYTPANVQPPKSHDPSPAVPRAKTPAYTPAHLQPSASQGPPPTVPRVYTPANANVQPTESHGSPPSVPLAYTPAHAQSPESHGPSFAAPRAKTPAYTPAHVQPPASQGQPPAVPPSQTPSTYQPPPRPATFVLPDDELIAKFPGPLKFKNKKKDVVSWMSSVISLLESDLRLEIFSIDEDFPTRRHENIMLWKVVKLLVENDGIFHTGTPSCNRTLRDILAPPVTHYSGDPSNYSDNGGAVNPPSSETVSLDSVSRIREHLLDGEREQAVWEAVDYRLWGHAMLLSSTLDKSVWKQVTQEFVRREIKAVGTNYDTLAALYDVFAGNAEDCVDELVPPSVRAGLQMVNRDGSSDSSKNSLSGLDKWQETLSLILSNRSLEDQQAFLSLSRLLSSFGRTAASHTCALFAKSPLAPVVGAFDDPNAVLVLLGVDHMRHQYSFDQDSYAVLLTEIYEFATTVLSTQSPGAFPHLLTFKLDHAHRLVDLGKITEAQQYCDAIATALKSSTRLAPQANPQLLVGLDELCKRLEQASADAPSSWIKPNMNKVSDSMWAKFHSFVAGDEADNQEHKRATSGYEPSLTAYSYGTIINHSDSRAASTTEYSEASTQDTVQPSHGYEPSTGISQGSPPAPERSNTPYSASQPSFGYEPQPPRPSSNYAPPKPSVNYEPPRATSNYGPSNPLSNYEPPKLLSAYEPPRPSSNYDPPKPSSAYEPPRTTSNYTPSNPVPNYEPPNPSSAYEPAQPSFGYEPFAPPLGYKPHSVSANASRAHSAADQRRPPYMPRHSYAHPSAGPAHGEARSSEEQPRSTSNYEPASLYTGDATVPSGNKEPPSAIAENDDEKAEEDSEKDDDDDKKQKQKSERKGWFSGWFSRKDNNSQGGKPIRAKLGEENSFFYDKDLKRWVNKKDPNSANAQPGGVPPPPKSKFQPPPRPPSAPTYGSIPPPSQPPVPKIPSEYAPQRPASAFRAAHTSSSSQPAFASFDPYASSPPTSPSNVPPAPNIAAVTNTTTPRPQSKSPNPAASVSAPPPPRPQATPSTNVTNASTIDDLLGEPQPPQPRVPTRPKRKARYVDVMSK